MNSEINVWEECVLPIMSVKYSRMSFAESMSIATTNASRSQLAPFGIDASHAAAQVVISRDIPARDSSSTVPPPPPTAAAGNAAPPAASAQAVPATAVTAGVRRRAAVLATASALVISFAVCGMRGLLASSRSRFRRCRISSSAPSSSAARGGV